MRFRVILVVFMGIISLNSCGSSSGSGGGNGTGNGTGNGNGNDDGQGGRPLTDAQCSDAWTAYVLAHPRGLKLRYENRGMGSTTTTTIEVTDSSDAAVTEKTTNNGQSDSNTTTKQEFLQTCKNPQTAPDQPVNVTIEERRKETKTVRAGTFSTDYVRSRVTQTSNEETFVVVSEVWSHVENFASFVVYSKSTSTMGSYTFENSMELMSVTQP